MVCAPPPQSRPTKLTSASLLRTSRISFNQEPLPQFEFQPCVITITGFPCSNRLVGGFCQSNSTSLNRELVNLIHGFTLLIAHGILAFLYPSTLNGYSSVKQPSGLYLVPLHSVVAATPANRYEI